MPLTNYAELQQTIEDYLENDDVSGNVVDFIRLAEARMDREISIQAMHKVFTDEISASEVALPSDYIEVVSWRLTGTAIDATGIRLTPDKFFGMIGQSTGGVPRYYTIVGTNAHWAPDPGTPDAGQHPYSLEYLAQIPALSDTNTTNWMLTRYPDVYLYASMLEAQPFLIDDARIEVWAGLYKQAITSLAGVDVRGRFRPGARMRPEGVPTDGKRWLGY